MEMKETEASKCWNKLEQQERTRRTENRKKNGERSMATNNVESKGKWGQVNYNTAKAHWKGRAERIAKEKWEEMGVSENKIENNARVSWTKSKTISSSRPRELSGGTYTCYETGRMIYARWEEKWVEWVLDLFRKRDDREGELVTTRGFKDCGCGNQDHKE
jgi:hypothetical protein